MSRLLPLSRNKHTPSNECCVENIQFTKKQQKKYAEKLNRKLEEDCELIRHLESLSGFTFNWYNGFVEISRTINVSQENYYKWLDEKNKKENT